MGEIISLNKQNVLDDSGKIVESEGAVVNTTEGVLADLNTVVPHKETISVPIAQLATLGSGVSSLIPALRTVTETTTISSDG